MCRNTDLRAADLLVGQMKSKIAPNHTCAKLGPHGPILIIWELPWGFLMEHGKAPVGMPTRGSSRVWPWQISARFRFSVWVEHALDVAENCSTPCPRPRIRPRRFCLGRISSLMAGSEQVWARMGGWLDPRRFCNAGVENPP